MASKKTESNTAQPTISKSEFVRRHPKLPVQELVKRAKAAGLEITDKFVWQIRWYEKNKVSAKAKTKAKKPVQASSANSKFDDLEARFLPLILEIGTARAETVVKATIERIRSIASKPR